MQFLRLGESTAALEQGPDRLGVGRGPFRPGGGIGPRPAQSRRRERGKESRQAELDPHPAQSRHAHEQHPDRLLLGIVEQEGALRQRDPRAVAFGPIRHALGQRSPRPLDQRLVQEE